MNITGTPISFFLISRRRSGQEVLSVASLSNATKLIGKP